VINSTWRGISVLRVTKPKEAAETVRAALAAAFDSGEPVAVLLAQSLIGRKEWTRSK